MYHGSCLGNHGFVLKFTLFHYCRSLVRATWSSLIYRGRSREAVVNECPYNSKITNIANFTKFRTTWKGAVCFPARFESAALFCRNTSKLNPKTGNFYHNLTVFENCILRRAAFHNNEVSLADACDVTEPKIVILGKIWTVHRVFGLCTLCTTQTHSVLLGKDLFSPGKQPI